MMEKTMSSMWKRVVLSISNRLYTIKIDEDPRAHDIASISRNG